jgi:hypothetical protein
VSDPRGNLRAGSLLLYGACVQKRRPLKSACRIVHWEHDPSGEMANARKPLGVMVHGIRLDRAELDSISSQVERICPTAGDDTTLEQPTPTTATPPRRRPPGRSRSRASPWPKLARSVQVHSRRRSVPPLLGGDRHRLIREDRQLCGDHKNRRASDVVTPASQSVSPTSDEECIEKPSVEVPLDPEKR